MGGKTDARRAGALTAGIPSATLNTYVQTSLPTLLRCGRAAESRAMKTHDQDSFLDWAKWQGMALDPRWPHGPGTHEGGTP